MNRTVAFCAMMAAVAVLTMADPALGVGAFVVGIIFFPWTMLE